MDNLSEEELLKLLIPASAKLIKRKYSLKKKGSWPCAFPNCTEKAIQSHLLQRNGVLDRIAESGHLYVPTERPAIHISERFKLHKTGVREALSYPVFCDYHDTYLFSSIETRPLNLANKWDNILLAYRSTATERRKKEIIKKVHEVLLAESSLEEDEVSRFIYADLVREIKLLDDGIRKLLEEEFLLGQWLNGKRDDSLFYTDCRIFPKLDICCTSVFSYLERKSETTAIICPVYFNMIPSGELSYISWSWINPEASKLIERFYQKNNEFLKLISDILLTKVENWVVSQSFFETYLKNHEVEMMKIFSTSHTLKEYNSAVDINMFIEWINKKEQSKNNI